MRFLEPLSLILCRGPQLCAICESVKAAIVRRQVERSFGIVRISNYGRQERRKAIRVSNPRLYLILML